MSSPGARPAAARRTEPALASLRMPTHLHVCEADERLVFLDLEADRYFCLPPAAEAAFRRLLSGAPDPGAGLDGLLGAGILVPAPCGKTPAITRYPSPDRSFVELGSTRRGARLTDAVEVGMLVAKARRAIARKALPRLLSRLAETVEAPDSQARDRLADLAERFLAARRMVPLAPNCLRDSLALRMFLERRGAVAALVIGVKLHPFGAHCWLQAGGMVLNDALSGAREFQPVLVV